MGLLLIFLAICSGMSYACYKANNHAERVSCAIAGFIIPLVMSGISTIIILAISFYSYTDIRAQYDSVINQYRGAIVMYEDRANIDVKKA